RCRHSRRRAHWKRFAPGLREMRRGHRADDAGVDAVDSRRAPGLRFLRGRKTLADALVVAGDPDRCLVARAALADAGGHAAPLVCGANRYFPPGRARFGTGSRLLSCARPLASRSSRKATERTSSRIMLPSQANERCETIAT